MKTILLSLLCTLFSITANAQENVLAITEYTTINYGDGRLLLREANADKTPLQGTHRLIHGYESAYIIADLKDGMFNGAYKYFKNNVLREEATYKEGRFDGLRTNYHHDGKTIQRQISYIDGKANGVSKTFSQSGNLESEKEFKLGIEDGFDRRYDSETNEISMDTNYKEGKQHGKWTEHISGNTGESIRISNFDNGIAVGEYSEIYVNSGIVRQKGNYKNGKKDGVWIDNRSRTNKRSAKYDNGDKIESSSFFTNGKISKLISFRDNKKHGVTKEYYLNGNVKSEFNFENGLECGEYKRYYEDGTLREEGMSENDSAISRKEYYDNGKLKSVAKRENGAWETIERYDRSGNKA